MRSKRRFLFSAIVGFIFASGVRIYQSRTRNRVPSPESMDSPEVAAAFNRIASWPQMGVLRWYVAQRILRLTEKGEGADIGCGPGHLLFHLAKEAPALQLVGIDLSEEVLSQAEASAAARGLAEKVSFKQGSAQELPFSDESLDLIVSSLSLHHWSEPTKVLDEVARVLRPGGAFLIFDLRRDMAPPFYLLLWFVTRFIAPAALRQLNEPLTSRNAAYSPGEVAQLASNSSLTGWRIVTGPLWVVLEGHTIRSEQK